MIIESPKHLHALDVVSVLLFSLLANYVIPLRVDFRAPVDLVEVVRLTLLAVGAILFYTVVVRLKEIADYSRAEYEAEVSLEAKAQRSVDERYREYFRFERAKLSVMLVLAVTCCIAFFLVQPVVLLLWPQ